MHSQEEGEKPEKEIPSSKGKDCPEPEEEGASLTENHPL